MRDEASLSGLRLNSDIAATVPFGDDGVGDDPAPAPAPAVARADDGGRGRLPAPPPPPAEVAADVAGLRDSLHLYGSVRWSFGLLRVGCLGVIVGARVPTYIPADCSDLFWLTLG